MVKRNFGLDLCRAIAIIMVIISHIRGYFSRYFYVDFLGINGFFAVELFFVLSGSLIGKIIIKDLVVSENKDLKKFYLRRWFRTLPAYYVIVIILSIYKNINIASLIFFQNFNEKYLEFFPVSWSLAVEEWFYLVIPIIFMLFVKNKKSFFIFCYSVIVIFLILRIFSFYLTTSSWDFGTRKVIFLRMDSLVIGVLFAGIKHYNNQLYEKLFRKYRIKTLVTAVILLLLFIPSYYLVNRDTSFYARTFMFSIISFIFIVFVCLSEMYEFQLSGKSKEIVTFISLTSYSVYLVHLELLSFILKKFPTRNIFETIISAILSLITIYIFSYLLYKFIEQPFLRLRNKITE